MEEEQLAKRAVKGDQDAFLALLQLHKKTLYKTALAYLRNENEALEALQEVTYRAYIHISSLREPAFAKTWLLRIMMNYCHDHARNKKRVVINEQLANSLAGDVSYEHMELLDAMEALDKRSQEVLSLKYFQDLKIAEIARLLDRPEGTIKTWLNRALQSLRTVLADREGGRAACPKKKQS
ncbi:sigma-70 family RNA polymerase sigma factor [Bacillus sp. 1P06AnD]|uniref:sigma-70 family RNA polymerase sigma factor n=1 Tax=Bacillus sp. 1P06AnD TaxID=3132208 RepID=UPI0039A16F1D